MFGMGFTEILIIAVIAILFLGPDKLPSTMVEIAKFFRNAKNTIGSMKDEALAYKKELQNASNQVKDATDIKKMAAKLTTLEDDNIGDSALFDKPKDEPSSKKEEVTFAKKKTQTTDKIEEDSKNV